MYMHNPGDSGCTAESGTVASPSPVAMSCQLRDSGAAEHWRW